MDMDKPLATPYADTHYDVIVVGAGPTGLTLAALLADAGTTVAVVDPQRIVCHHPRATHIDDETIRVLQMFGADDEERFLRHLGHLTLDEQKNVLVAHKMDGPRTDQGYWSDYQFHQPDFESKLRGRLASSDAASLWLGWTGVELTQDDHVAELLVEDLRTGERHRLTSSYLVGADGAGSWVRASTGADIEDLHGTQTSMIVDIFPFGPSPELDPQVGFSQNSQGWPVIYVPIQPPMLRFERMLRPGDDPREHERPENVYSLLRPWLSPGSYRIMRTQVYTWHSHLVTTWRTGRIFVAGDAAHTMTPMLGQGMCSGLRDATNLAWKLTAVLSGQCSEALLDTYQSERIPQVRPYIEVSAMIANLFEQQDPGNHATREDSTPAAGSPPAVVTETEVHDTARFRPLLGPGLHDEKRADQAMLAPQPTSDGGVRFDALVGYRFGVYLTAELIDSVDDETRGLWQQLGVVPVVEASRDFETWSADHGYQALVVRPDRYVYAAVKTADELRKVTAELRDRLMIGVSA